MSFKNEATYSLIDQPGFYTYGGDVFFDPQDPNDNGVLITASNVTLDLQDHTISQTVSNTIPGLDAIFISPNLTNIKIRNGTITNVTGRGIYVGDGCSGVYIENLILTSCQATGVLFDGSQTGSGIINGKIKKSIITSCTGVNGNPAYGLRMIETSNIIIYDSIFNSNDALITSSGYGVILESCSNCEFDSCKFNANGGNQLGIGAALINSDDCTFANCVAIENISHSAVSSSTACGFLFDSSRATACSLCKSVDNSNVNATGIGFMTLNGSGNSFVNCVAENNSGLFAAGFLFTGTEASDALLNSESVANIGSFIGGISYGVLINGPQGCAIADNVFSANIGAQGYGLVDTTTDTNNYIASNLSYANTTTGYSVFRTTGTFPVAYASVGNFTGIIDVSRYVNIAIVPG